MNLAAMKLAVLTATLLMGGGCRASVDWSQFLSRHDLLWNFTYGDADPRENFIPVRWTEGAYIGNGMMGAMVMVDNRSWPEMGTAKLTFSINRVDAWTSLEWRPDPNKGWRRSPIGSLVLDTGVKWGQGRVDMQVKMHDAELLGQVVVGSTAAISFRAMVGADRMAESTLVLDVNSTGIVPEIWWEPCSVQRGPRGKHGDICDSDAPVNCSCVPSRKVSNAGEAAAFYQETQGLAKIRAGWTTALAVDTAEGEAGSRSTAWLTTSNSLFDRPVPGNGSIGRAQAELNRRKSAGLDSLVSGHRAWWHSWWPLSFVSIPDARLEAMYYVSMYRFVSSVRHGIHDLTGSFGPMGVTFQWGDYMWDMNPQVSYFSNHASNRLELVEPFVAQFDVLAKQGSWSDHYGGDFPQGVELLWMLKNYWRYTRYTHDHTREQTSLLTLLKQGMQPLVENQYVLPAAPPADSRSPCLLDDGTHIHVVGVTSPEYPASWNVPDNCNFTALTHNCTNTNFGLSMLSWGLRTTLEILDKFEIFDPLRAIYEDLYLRMYPLSYDHATGYWVDWVHRLDLPHRHWSHILSLYDLDTVKVDSSLAETSIDRWAGLTCNDSIACPTHCRGFTRGAVGIMSARLGRGEAAAGNLSKFLDPVVGVIQPNGRYGEGVTEGGAAEWYEISPCDESGYIGSAVLHEMLLQSDDRNEVTVFGAVPASWKEVVFDQLRTQSGLLVTAARRQGLTAFVQLEATQDGEYALIVKDWKLGTQATPSTIPKVPVRQRSDGATLVALKVGTVVTFFIGTVVPDRTIRPVSSSNPSQQNWFGMQRAPTCMAYQCTAAWPTFMTSEQCDSTYYCDTHAC